MFCPKCGKELPNDAKFCDGCGASMSGNGNASASGASFEEKVKNLNNTADHTSEFDAGDIEKNKVLSLFAYLGILLLIPLLATNNSKYARFHVNQGLILLIVEIAWGIVFGIVSSIFGALGLGIIAALLSIVSGLGSLALFVLMILGIVNAVTGKAKELPLIGKFNLLK